MREGSVREGKCEGGRQGSMREGGGEWEGGRQGSMREGGGEWEGGGKAKLVPSSSSPGPSGRESEDHLRSSLKSWCGGRCGALCQPHERSVLTTDVCVHPCPHHHHQTMRRS